MRCVLVCLLLNVAACDSEPEFVGDMCTPEVIPAAGFDRNEAAVDLTSAQCGGNPCLVYKLGGDPTNICNDAGDPGCVTQAEVAARVYCSCRCDGAPSGEPECDCPDGFQCIPAFDTSGPDIDGSYCVKKGT